MDACNRPPNHREEALNLPVIQENSSRNGGGSPVGGTSINMTSKHQKIPISSGGDGAGTKKQEIDNFSPKQTFLVVSTPNLYKFAGFFKILTEGVHENGRHSLLGNPRGVGLFDKKSSVFY